MKRSAMITISAAALAASTLPALAQTANTVRFGVVGVEEAALPYYAQEKGLFKAAGLDVTLTVLGNGGAVTSAVLGGALDVGITNSGSIQISGGIVGDPNDGQSFPLSFCVSGAFNQ